MKKNFSTVPFFHQIKNIISTIVLVLFVSGCLLLGISAEYAGKTKFSEKPLLQFPVCLCVTDDGTILVTDIKAKDVKIYSQDGTFVKLLCRNGYGPNEIAQPFYCHYSNNKLLITDSGQLKIFIYEKKGRFDFVRAGEVSSLGVGWDHCLVDGVLYVSGNKINNDNESYAFYSAKIAEENTVSYYLPSMRKFGLDSVNEFKKKYFGGVDFAAIGYKGGVDIHGDHAYFYWECDLKIFKINLKTKTISTFGEKPTHYVKPFLSKRLEDAWKTMQGKIVWEERKKMSYIWQIFATEKYVAVVYNLPEKDNEQPVHAIQFYTHAGKLLNECTLSGVPGPPFYFDKRDNYLYALYREESGADPDESFYFLKYKIKD